MLAYARGSVRAFEQLYARHKGATYRYFLRHADGHVATAEELHQDLWMRVAGSRERYAVRARFATWLYTLARHRLIDHWRSRHAVDIASLEDEATRIAAEEIAAPMSAAQDDPLRATMDAQARGRLLRALSEVPPLQRDAFLLHIEGGLSLEEIAELTGRPAETIKSRLRYAYRKLRAALEELQ